MARQAPEREAGRARRALPVRSRRACRNVDSKVCPRNQVWRGLPQAVSPYRLQHTWGTAGGRKVSGEETHERGAAVAPASR